MKRLYKTVAFVTLLSCFERFLGFLYRIYLSRKIGAEGLGIYQIALSVAGVIVTLTASGIPVTVSRLMIKDKASGRGNGDDAVTAGILSALAISIPLCLLFYFGKPFLKGLFADERCYGVLIIILPGVVLTSVYACVRGFFWGNRYYGLYSAIELIEEAAMCVVGVLLTLKVTDSAQAAENAGKAVLVSYVVSFVLSTLAFILKSGKIKSPRGKLRPLVASAAPITLTRAITSLIGSLVAVLIPARMVASGADASAVTTSFGELSGMALPLLFIPSTVIGSIALVSLPEISESYYRGNFSALNKGVTTAFDCSLFISALIIPFFFGAGREIGEFLYANANAGDYLSLSAFIMLPMSVSMICCSALNSLGKEKLTLKNFLIGSIAMLSSCWFLSPLVGVSSLIIGYAASYLITAFLDVLTMEKTLKQGNASEFSSLFLRTLKIILVILPSALFSLTVKKLVARFSSLFLTLFITGTCSVAFTSALIFTLCLDDAAKAFPALKKFIPAKRTAAPSTLDKRLNKL